MRVLLVEDEPFIALDLELLVAGAGHEVVGVAQDTTQALAMARDQRPEAALIDVNLKDGMTGLAICRTLCFDHGVRAAFVTGNDEHVPADRAGALAVVQKPFNDRQVAEVLRLLDGRAA